MTKNEIFEILADSLGPLKTRPQPAASKFEKFEELLRVCLSQPKFIKRTTGTSFQNFQSHVLPEQVNLALERMADQILIDQAARQPTDPVYWLRKRNIAVIAGIEESVENYITPRFSFGPFLTEESTQEWFDLYEDPAQLRFQTLDGQNPDFLIISFPEIRLLPNAGGYRDQIIFEDCTLWFSIKSILPGADKKYVGVRAKQCEISFNDAIEIQSNGVTSVFNPNFQIGFQPFDEFSNHPGEENAVKSGYPSEMTISFTGAKWSLQSCDKTKVIPFGDTVNFEKAENVDPVLFDSNRYVRVPLVAEKDFMETDGSGAQSFQVAGKSEITETGWYLPVIDINNDLGFNNLGTLLFSGYFGFKGAAGLTLSWPGLENGSLKINNFLLLSRPGRTFLKYNYRGNSRISQKIRIWKSNLNKNVRSAVVLEPDLTGDGYCMQDNQQMEALFQPVNISAKTDSPLSANQKPFEISGHAGAAIFIRTGDVVNTALFGILPKPLPGEVKKRRIPQSICLKNALLVTDNPFLIFVAGMLLPEGIILDGSTYLGFPVFRLLHTLPDPYLINQTDLQNPELGNFNDLWTSGKDTLPDKFNMRVTACIRWSEEDTSLSFSLNNAFVNDRRGDVELLDRFREKGNLCRSQNDGSPLHNEDLMRANETDTANVVGAFGYLQWLPGNLSLVDVSESANRWGVSFSNTTPEDRLVLSENLGLPSGFPVRIKNMAMVTSGRIARLFTLPHIQFEPVMKIDNSNVSEPLIPSIINFRGNGNATRISTSNKDEVELIPRELYKFIIEGFNAEASPSAMAANFSLPFGICANAYFNPSQIEKLPFAWAGFNEPKFSDKKKGELKGGLQLHLEAVPPKDNRASETDTHLSYFIGSATQELAEGVNVNILGDIIGKQFNDEFSSGTNAKVPLERIDFAGYGASIFSNWLNPNANFGSVSQVKFDVLIGRTAHEVIQVKSILFPWGVPVVRSIVIQRKNSGIVTRYDSGWIARGPGIFNFLSYAKDQVQEDNPYTFHPGMVKGIFNVTEIKDTPAEMNISKTEGGVDSIFSGVYFNGDIEIENIEKGALPKKEGEGLRTHSVGQFGYVMLANPSEITERTQLGSIFSKEKFKELLNDPKVGGNLGGPVNALINIGGTGQKLQATRVDVSPGKGGDSDFVVAVRGTIDLPKEGSWTVVKCLPTKAVIPITQNEAVPVIRNGALSIHRNNSDVTFKTNDDSRYFLGDPGEIDSYKAGAPLPQVQYSLLQSTDAQKLLFRTPSFIKNDPKIHTEVPDFADAFRLMKCNTIFPDLSQALSLPDAVKSLNITGNGNGLKFDDNLLPVLESFTPKQINAADAKSSKFYIINQKDFQVYISYESPAGELSKFKVELNSEAIEGEGKKWQNINKDVAIVVNLGSVKPLLTLRGQFRSEAGEKPAFDNAKLELGDELQAVKNILQILAILAMKGEEFANSLVVSIGNTPDIWQYKMSIDQKIPVIQFPDTALITIATPPLLIIEASLLLGVFFNLSLSPDPSNLIKPGAGAVLGFEGMIQIQLITIGIAAAYGVGITKIRAFVDLTDPKPDFEFTFGFGATVIVDLPVVGLASITRSFSLTGSMDSDKFRVLAGQMIRGVLSLAGGLLIVSIQIEGSTGIENNLGQKKTKALFRMMFSLDVSLAFVLSYDFNKPYSETIDLN